MITIRPITQAVGFDNPDRQISVSQWNMGHVLTASPDVLIGTDGTGAAQEYPVSDFALVADLAAYATDAELAAGLATKAPLAHTHVIADTTGLQAALDSKVDDSEMAAYATDAELAAGLANYIPLTQKGAANGVATLDGGSKVPASQLPSYVDDVVEVANYAALPVTGETGKIYITLDTNYQYRWSGSTYVQLAGGAGGAVWGAITGTLSAQTDLNTALNAKANLAGGNIFTGAQSITGLVNLAGATGGIRFDDRDGAGSMHLYNNNDTLRVNVSAVDRFTLAAATGNLAVTGTITLADEAYAAAWDGKLEAPTKNAVYDKIQAVIATIPPATVWGGITGTLSNQTDLQTALTAKANTAGAAFTGTITVPDDPYGVGWNGSQQVPTKNAIYDKIETIVAGGGSYLPLIGGTLTGDLILNEFNPMLVLRDSSSITDNEGRISWQSSDGTERGWVAGQAGDLTVNATGNLLLDTDGYIQLNTSAGTVCHLDAAGVATFNLNKVVFDDPNIDHASIRLPHGTEPITLANGDMWTTTAGLYARINGATVGPLGSGGGAVSDTAYGSSWDGVTAIAPSKNAVYDKIEALSVGGGGVTTFNTRSGAVTLTAADVSAAGANAFVANGKVSAVGVNANKDNASSSTNRNPGVTVFSMAGFGEYGMELGHVGGDFATRVFCPSSKTVTIGGLAVDGTLQSSFTNWGVFNAGGLAVTGKVAASNGVNANSTNAASTTARNPGAYVFSTGGNDYGMELGYKGSTFATRLFCAAGANVVTIGQAGGPNQTDFADWATFSGTGLAVSGTITSAGSTLATVSQLANYLPLTGGTLSGALKTQAGILETGASLLRVENTGGVPPAGAAGAGMELIGVIAGNSRIQCFNRTSIAYNNLEIDAAQISLRIGTTPMAVVDATGINIPTGATYKINGVPIGGGGGLTDGDKGDVVVSGGGTVLTVESAAGAFTATGQINGAAGIRLTGTTMARFENNGWGVPTGFTGQGVEINGGAGAIQSYNYTAGAFGPLQFLGSPITFNVAPSVGGSPLATVSQLANYLPLTGGSLTGALNFNEGATYLGRTVAAAGQLYYEADWHNWRSAASVGYATLNSTGLAVTGAISATGQLVVNGTGHTFGAAAAGATGQQISINAPLTQTDIYFNSHTGGAQQDASIHAVRGTGLFLNGNPTTILRAAGNSIATVDATGINLVAGMTYRINGVAIGGGSADGLGPDGDKGDVTVGGTGTTLTIDAGAVSLAKMANLAANSFIGNNTGSAATPLALSAANAKTLLAITAADVAAAAGFTVIGKAATGAGACGEIALTAGTLLGRGTTGNVAALAIGATLTFGGAATLAVASVPNAVTFNNGGAGAASGTTFDGSVARTISYNSIGAQPAIPPVVSTTSNATLTPDSTKDMSIRSTQTVNLTIAAPSGTPVDAQGHVLRIKATAAIATVSWNATYRAVGVVLPTALVSGKTTYVGMIWNALDSFWDVVSVATQA